MMIMIIKLLDLLDFRLAPQSQKKREGKELKRDERPTQRHIVTGDVS